MSDMSRIFIAGGTSAIAQETARAFAAEGASFFLVGRSQERLTAVASDLRVRGAGTVAIEVADLADLSRHEELLSAAEKALSGLDVVLIAHGVLPDQEACVRDVGKTMEALSTNLLSAISLLTIAASRLEAKGSGVLAAISSVAGDRGRKSNYVYGAAKGGLSVFLQGLRNRLAHSRVAVVTIKPGFVDTPMTAHIPKNTLFATPAKVGRAIHRAIRERRDVVYVPGYWRLILFVIRAVPERIFKRLNL